MPNSQINLLRQSARAIIRELGLLNDAHFEVGVTLAERHLLIELSSSTEPLTAKDIAGRLLLDKSTISRLVARAVKKRFITYSTDQKDRRRRLLQLTDLGKDTLSAFELIAFNQTKNALQTLNSEEMNRVYEGVALYAQGLKNSRLKNRSTSSLDIDTSQLETLEEIQNQLHCSGYKLEQFKAEHEEPLFSIFQEVVDAGCLFPYENNTIEEFHTQFFSPGSQVYVCRSLQGTVMGGFYLKPNYPGRSGHISNAAYMIKNTHRGKGVGTLLIKASLQIARNLGFLAMQLNMVLSQNRRAIKLYERLGFGILCTIPSAVRNVDGSFQDGHIMYRKIEKQ